MLVEEAAAIEGLARVDVVGIDKTGTLTEGSMTVGSLVPLAGTAAGCTKSGAAEALGALAHADERLTPSMRALAEEFAAPVAWRATDRVPFSSARKWSGSRSLPRDLGPRCPDVLLEPGTPVLEQAEGWPPPGTGSCSSRGASGPWRTRSATRAGALGARDLTERLRPDAADTLRYFAEEDVEVKVISGDSPRTVAAVASALGLPGADRPVDAAPVRGSRGGRRRDGRPPSSMDNPTRSAHGALCSAATSSP